MKLIRGLTANPLFKHGSVVTVGNFDGLHSGHVALIDKVVSIAKEQGLTSVLLTFEPKPWQFFARESRFRLMRLKEFLSVLQATDIDAVVVLRFNETLASISAEQFIKMVLLQFLRAKHLVLGDDFHFGKDREGNLAYLLRHQKTYSFTIDNLPAETYGGQRISSSWVREALLAERYDLVRKLLSRSYTISGRVVKGRQLGRELGFPTANIEYFGKHVPLHGVYAVQVNVDGAVYPAIANVGTKPTIMSAAGKKILEVHIPGYSSDLYGKYLQISIIDKLRDEIKFADLDLLRAQIRDDVARLGAALAVAGV
ncbi:MAG: bifunctional riboflavin kinase/FAD synthetase [Methylococcales bacterium]|nr:bifunctional riboflavin kinase/FAD synthetase [Methylococcales bacterium]